MQGPIYDYKNQRWTEIDTDTDEKTGEFSFVTKDGVPYEVGSNNPELYRNLPTEG